MALYTSLISQSVNSDLYVSPQGDDIHNSGTSPDSPFKTVSHAMYMITPDPLTPRTIYVAPGEYGMNSGELFSLWMKSHVTLQGAGAMQTIFKGDDLGDITEFRHSIITSNKNATNFKIRDIGFEGWGLSPNINRFSAAISLRSFKDVVIENCHFKNGMIGITYDESHDINIGGTAIFRNLVFENLVKCSLSPLAKECIVENVIISGQQYIIDPDTGNYIFDIPIYFGKADDFNLFGQFAPFRRSITLSNILMYDNVSYVPASYYFGCSAISFGKETDVIMSNVTITGNRAVLSPDIPSYKRLGAIRIGENSNIKIYNSIIYDNSPGSFFYQHYYGTIVPNGILTIKNTLLQGGRDALDNETQHSLSIVWRANNLDADPLFDMTDASFPYQLSEYSPAIAAGTLDIRNGYIFPETDIMGNPRITNGEIDMGAYQRGRTADFDETIPLAHTALLGNYPNPFNPSTTISFDMAQAGHARVEIYNIKGQRVRVLVDGMYGVGTHNVVWNGDDTTGRSVGSGVYFYRMTTSGYSSTRKMLLMK